jgi:hypothetical protein
LREQLQQLELRASAMREQLQQTRAHLPFRNTNQIRACL